MRTLVGALLRVYQLAVRPLMPAACRFHPSCSQYAREAVERRGAARGLWLAAKRVARCHPFSAGGVDVVPDFSS